MGCCLRDHTESDTTEVTQQQKQRQLDSHVCIFFFVFLDGPEFQKINFKYS